MMPPSPLTPAERARRYRERRKLGVLVATTQVPLSITDVLMRHGLLSADDIGDGAKVGAAMIAFIQKNDRHA